MKREFFSFLFLLCLSLFLIIKIFFLQVVSGADQVTRASQNRFRINTIEASRGIFYDWKGNVLVDNKDDERNYLYPEEFAHVLGYLGEADSKEMVQFGVDLGRKIGKMGIEREENSNLKGIDGGVVEEYDAKGEKIRSFSKKSPISGQSLVLTLDKDLQILAYKELEKYDFNGSVIVSRPDGEILSLVSYPSFDPNAFSRGDGEYISELFSNERTPFFNRAIAGVYPPGSTFKIITSLAALSENVIDENYTIEDTGVIEAGGTTFSNWFYTSRGGTDGIVNVVKGLQRSNDIFFYKVGGELGIDKLSYWAKKLGLGQKTGISLEGESDGLVPDPVWKEENWDEDWYLGDTYITAIGQGNLQITPIQINRMTNMVASDGYLCQPKLIEKRFYEDLKIDKEELDYKDCGEVDISKENIAIVKKGLLAACQTGGTGWPMFNFAVNTDWENPNVSTSSANLKLIEIGCKTGTAETGRYSEENPKIQLTHAWFTAFAPFSEPEIVVTVLLEDGGEGSDKPAMITREIMKRWFEKEGVE